MNLSSNKKINKFIILSLGLAISLSSCSGFKKFFNDVGSGIEQGASQVASWGQDVYSHAASWTVEAWNNVCEWSTNVGEAVANWGQDVVNNVKHFFCNVGDFFVDIANNVVSFGMSTLYSSLNVNYSSNESLSEDELNEYKDDPEAITYSLISNQYKKAFDFFPAKIVIPSTLEEINGFAYTDYENAYEITSENEKETYYASGFISLVGETEITDDILNKGLEIIPTDSYEEPKKYFFAFSGESFETHCIIRDKYLKYGVNDKHQIFYSSSNYESISNTDKSLGGLYSFDESKFLYGEDDGFVPCSGSLEKEIFENIDWKSEAINALKNGFSINLSSLGSIVNNAYTKIKTVINELKGNTILGYNIDSFKNEVNKTNEGDVAIVSEEKVAMHSSGNEPASSGLSDVAKWLIGIGTGLMVLADIAVSIFFPKYTWGNIALNAAMSAVSGAFIETFVETVVSNNSFNNVNWIKVGIASIAGALTSLFITEGSNKIKNSLVISLTTAFTNTIYSFMDGKDIFDCSLSFISTFATTILMTTLLSSIISGLANVVKKIAPKLTNKISNFISTHQVFIGDKSATECSKSFISSINNASSDSADKVSYSNIVTENNKLKKAVNCLPSTKNKYLRLTNADGVEIVSKKDILQKFNGNCNIELRDIPGGNKYQSLFIDKNGKLVNSLPVKNGYIQFENVSQVKVQLNIGNTITNSRSKNFSSFDEKLKDMLINSPENVPDFIKNYFNGRDFSTLTKTDFKKMRSALNLTWHENEDLISGLLVDSTLHGALSHMGGFAIIKSKIAATYSAQILKGVLV